MKNSIVCASVLAGIGAFVLFSAHAADSERAEEGATDSTGIPEIVVTASKRAQTANTVPMSITAVSGDALAVAGVTDVFSLTKIVPGFNAVDSSYGTPVYFLRGVGYFDTSLYAKPAVGVYIDEVPLPYSVMTLGTTLDLERVEVLKGPQGTLFGSNATGGGINYVAAKPTRTFQAGIDTGFGRFGDATAGGFVSGPISDTLSARFALHHESRGDWQESVSRPGDGAGQRDFTTARAQLLWEPSTAFRALLSATGFVDRSDTQAAQFVAVVPVASAASLPPTLLTMPPYTGNARQAEWTPGWPLGKDNDMYQTSLRADYNVSDSAMLTSITSFAHYKQNQSQDADGTVYDISNYTDKGTVDSFNQELRLSGDIDRILHYVVGANYERSKSAELQGQFSSQASSSFGLTPLGFGVVQSITVPQTDLYTSKAVFGNAELNVTNTITLQGGLRYTKTDTDFSACTGQDPNGILASALSLILSGGNAALRNQLLNEANASGCVTADTVSPVPTLGRFYGSLPEDNVSWRAGIDFKPTDGELYYANISRGFKSGSFSGIPATNTINYTPVPQEKLTAYEVGFKNSLLDRKLQLNGAVFYYDYVDKQLIGRLVVPIFGAQQALVSIPKSHIDGAELQVTAAPLHGLQITIGGTYIDSKVTSDYTNYNIFGQLADFKDASFPYTSKLQMNGDTSYTWLLRPKANAFVGASVTYRSSASGDFLPDPRVAIDAYGLLDLRAGIEDPNGAWRISLYGRNVTDKYYWTTATRRADSIVRWAGMPATYGVDMSVRF